MTTDIYSLIDSVAQNSRWPADYVEKMMHAVPDAPVVDRERFILDRCAGKKVLNLGAASGDLHEKIKSVALSVVGVDKQQPTNVLMDLDENPDFVDSQDFDLIVAGEIIEHLANPGRMLKAVRRLECPLVLSTTNAFADIGRSHLKRGFENVNKDHVSWYSYKTIKTLLERYNFTIEEFAWYNGKPLFAEGFVLVAH